MNDSKMLHWFLIAGATNYHKQWLKTTQITYRSESQKAKKDLRALKSGCR